jgi:hypothetical protein
MSGSASPTTSCSNISTAPVSRAGSSSISKGGELTVTICGLGERPLKLKVVA